jgi:hypothetical protein
MIILVLKGLPLYILKSAVLEFVPLFGNSAFNCLQNNFISVVPQLPFDFEGLLFVDEAGQQLINEPQQIEDHNNVVGVR